MDIQIDIVHIFDYRFLKNDSVDVDIFNRACNIERSKGNTANQPRDIGPVMSALENRAILMSVMDSNAIEGIRTTEDRLVALVSGKVSPIGHDECEIAGYRDALRFIHLNHGKIILNKEFILELYNMLMSNTGDGPFGFKERDNVIIDRGADGTITNMYRTVSAAETEKSNAVFGAFAAVHTLFPVKYMALFCKAVALVFAGCTAGTTEDALFGIVKQVRLGPLRLRIVAPKAV